MFNPLAITLEGRGPIETIDSEIESAMSFAERPLLNAKDEGEVIDLSRKLGERERLYGSFIEVVKLKRLEIGDEDIARKLGFL